MLWAAIGLSLVTVIVVMATIRTKRSASVDKLGAVSDRWIDQHHSNLP